VLEGIRTAALVLSAFLLGWWLAGVAGIVLLTIVALATVLPAYLREGSTPEPTSPTDTRNASVISAAAAAVLLLLEAIGGWLDLPGALLAASAGVVIGTQLAISIREDRRRRDAV
jgi:hypothetical protein